MEYQAFMEQIQERSYNDPTFYARLIQGNRIAKEFSIKQKLENRPDLTITFAVAVGLLMAEKDPTTGEPDAQA